MVQGSRRISGGRRSRYIVYGLVLLQTLVLIGYFLPWYQSADGLLLRIYSDLTHDSYNHVIILDSLLIACFIVTVVSLALTLYMVGRDGREIPVLRVVASLSGFAIAGPLIYVQVLLGFEPEWSDLRDRLGELGVGWFLALPFGLCAGILALYMLKQTYNSVRRGPPATVGLFWGPRGIPRSVILMVLFASGVAVAVMGYFQSWNSMASVTMFGTTTSTGSGVDMTPLMCLVPLAAILAFALLLLGQSIKGAGGLALMSAAQSTLVTGTTLTVFWGAAIGEYETSWRSGSLESALQTGWYVCMLGQVFALVCLMLMQRSGGHQVADSDLHSDHQMK